MSDRGRMNGKIMTVYSLEQEDYEGYLDVRVHCEDDTIFGHYIWVNSSLLSPASEEIDSFMLEFV